MDHHHKQHQTRQDCGHFLENLKIQKYRENESKCERFLCSKYNNVIDFKDSYKAKEVVNF